MITASCTQLPILTKDIDNGCYKRMTSNDLLTAQSMGSLDRDLIRSRHWMYKHYNRALSVNRETSPSCNKSNNSGRKVCGGGVDEGADGAVTPGKQFRTNCRMFGSTGVLDKLRSFGGRLLSSDQLAPTRRSHHTLPVHTPESHGEFDTEVSGGDMRHSCDSLLVAEVQATHSTPSTSFDHVADSDCHMTSCSRCEVESGGGGMCSSGHTPLFNRHSDVTEDCSVALRGDGGYVRDSNDSSSCIEVIRRSDDDATNHCRQSERFWSINRRHGGFARRWYQLIKNAADKDSVASGVSAKPIGRSHKRTESAHSILSAPSSDDNSPQPQQQLQQHHLSSKGSPSPRPKSTAVFPAPPEENSTESGSEPGSSTSPGVVDTVNSETSSKANDHHKPQQQQQQTQHQQQQKFEFIEASSLIDPSEVVVSYSVVHSAHSVVTPLERVRRADEQIRKALRQKQSVLDELITQQQPESTCSNNNVDGGCGEDDEEVPTQRLVLQAAVNVNSCVALIVGAMSKSQQSVSDTSTTETNSCSNSSSSTTSPSDSSCIQCVDVRESTVPTLEQLLQMQQQLADTLTQLLVSVERQQSERQQLRQLLERVHLLERQLSETASAQQSQQRQQTSMKEEEESSTMAVVDESAPQHNNSDSESLVEDKEQIDGAGVVECQQQQQANVEQIDGAGVVENQLQRQTNVKHIDGFDDHQQQQKAEVEQVDCSTAVECMEQQQQQQTGVLDVCSSPLPSQLETPAGEGSVLDDCTTGPTLLDTSGEEGVDDAVSLSKESCDTLCQQDQEHDESRDSSSSYDDASTLTTREKNELSAVDLQSSETTEPLVDTDPAPSSTTESPVSSSSQEISHAT